jgi:hypothetical protein
MVVTGENRRTRRKACPRAILKGKGVPLHAMKAHGGRGGIIPTHT